MWAVVDMTGARPTTYGLYASRDAAARTAERLTETGRTVRVVEIP